MRQRKSQITIFMIIALVLFIIIGFFFYLNKHVIKKQASHETAETQATKIELQPIENYVVQCLDKTAKEGLLLLGKQGGYLYESQGGYLIDFREEDEGLFFVNYNNNRVSYGIYPLRFDVWPYYSKAPDYPWVTFPYTDETKRHNKSEGLFGISNLPPINSSFGANSVKSQLEHYIKEKIKECIDWSVFKNYEVTENNLNVKLGIAEKDLMVYLTYPITIKNKINNDVSSMQDFSVKVKIRLKKIYDFTYSLINRDINDIEFDIGEASENGLSVNVIRDAFKQDDIIIVKDENSLINNAPYKFAFARHNRMPALYYITPVSMTLPDGYNITVYDLIPGYPLSLKAIDPDEDMISSDSYFIQSEVIQKIKLKEFSGVSLHLPKIEFKINASDGLLGDYQVITVFRGT